MNEIDIISDQSNHIQQGWPPKLQEHIVSEALPEHITNSNSPKKSARQQAIDEFLITASGLIKTPKGTVLMPALISVLKELRKRPASTGSIVQKLARQEAIADFDYMSAFTLRTLDRTAHSDSTPAAKAEAINILEKLLRHYPGLMDRPKQREDIVSEDPDSQKPFEELFKATLSETLGMSFDQVRAEFRGIWARHPTRIETREAYHAIDTLIAMTLIPPGSTTSPKNDFGPTSRLLLQRSRINRIIEVYGELAPQRVDSLIRRYAPIMDGPKVD